MTIRAALILAVATASAALPADGQESPARHLVYTFTMGVQSDTHAIVATAPQMQPGGTAVHINDQAPANKSASSSESSGVSSDAGTIDVDVFTAQADGGLHVRVSETSHSSRNASPTDCVVYPSTSVACGTRISSEAALVLSTLSPQFFQPSALDAKNHWSVRTNVPGLSLDFTASAPKDSVVWITEDRKQKLSSGSGGTLRGSATFAYDTGKRLSTDVKDHETIEQGDSGQSSNTTVDISATLASDSGPVKN
jgi:hypothetical protein